MARIRTLKLIGHVDERHRLSADVPAHVAPGPAEVELCLPSDTEDDGGDAWASAVAAEWAAELADPREDIYTLDDGEPINASR